MSDCPSCSTSNVSLVYTFSMPTTFYVLTKNARKEKRFVGERIQEVRSTDEIIIRDDKHKKVARFPLSGRCSLVD